MLFIRVCGEFDVTRDCSRLGWNRLVNLNLTYTFGARGEYAVPKRLHDWEVMCKPFTVALNLDDDKLFWRTLFVLEEITHLEIHNFK